MDKTQDSRLTVNSEHNVSTDRNNRQVTSFFLSPGFTVLTTSGHVYIRCLRSSREALPLMNQLHSVKKYIYKEDFFKFSPNSPNFMS